jgi:hypothetical protein
MPGRLIEQLLEVGLVTQAQARASDPGGLVVSTSRLIQNLVAQGLDERVLAGFFVSRGYGPMLQTAQLARADLNLVRRLPTADAHELCAIPLRPSPAGAIVAMADPTDERAITRLSELLGGSILPTVAKLSDLLAAIDRVYPPERPSAAHDPIAPARSRALSGLVPLARHEPAIGADEPSPDLDSSLSELASRVSPAWDRAWDRARTERELSRAPEPGRVPLPTVSPAPSPHPSAPWPSAPAPPDRVATARPAAVSDSGIDRHLAELGQVSSRDDAVSVACRACLSSARGAAFLALRQGVFRGWDGAGEDITSASIRSLWVPASNPSVLSEVLHSGRIFRGNYGQTAADHLFRAALGSHGREVLVVPVLVASRVVGFLCANDPAADTGPVERVAEALGQAFERLIASRKSGP